jgi:hypothetical protein
MKMCSLPLDINYLVRSLEECGAKIDESSGSESFLRKL